AVTRIVCVPSVASSVFQLQLEAKVVGDAPGSSVDRSTPSMRYSTLSTPAECAALTWIATAPDTDAAFDGAVIVTDGADETVTPSEHDQVETLPAASVARTHAT